MPCCVLIHRDEESGEIKLSEVEVDGSDRNDFVGQTLGGKATIVGAWNDSSVIMLSLVHPSDVPLPPSLHPSCNCDQDLFLPIMITELDSNFNPVSFTVKKYEEEILPQSSD